MAFLIENKNNICNGLKNFFNGAEAKHPILNKEIRIRNSVRTKLLYQVEDLKVQVCIVIYLPTVLMEVCNLNLVYWSELHLLYQDGTEF